MPEANDHYRSMRVLMGDLYPLADPEVEHADEHLRTMYGWCVDHATTVIRITLGAAGALLVAFITELLKANGGPTPLTIVLGGSVVVLAGVGFFRLGRLATIHREFAAAQGLLTRYRQIHRLMHTPPP